ncbi:unnamed protein product [Ixodes pacificus]
MADEERAAWGAGSELPADLQAPDGPEVLDLSRQGLDAPTADTNLALLDDTARVRVVRLQHNLLERLPDRVGALSRLHTLDVSHNRLGALPEELGALPALRVLLAAGNRLRYLPKALAGLADLEVVNLSGNHLDALPPPLLALGSLRALYLGANRLECVPEDIGKLQKLEVLYLGGNRLQELPAGLGSLGQLQSLVLSGNRLVALPPSLSCLHRLRSLALHDNLLTTLPPCLVRLQNLVELSLRGNPLVVRFVRDLTYEPPRLRELAARCVKIHRLPCGEGELPPDLLAYLDTARRCVNPRCKGEALHFASAKGTKPGFGTSALVDMARMGWRRTEGRASFLPRRAPSTGGGRGPRSIVCFAGVFLLFGICYGGLKCNLAAFRILIISKCRNDASLNGFIWWCSFLEVFEGKEGTCFIQLFATARVDCLSAVPFIEAIY